jgi:hypothetical protein
VNCCHNGFQPESGTDNKQVLQICLLRAHLQLFYAKGITVRRGKAKENIRKIQVLMLLIQVWRKNDKSS